MPYVSTFLTSIALLDKQRSMRSMGFLLGTFNLLLFGGYILGVLGNHYLKILSFYLNIFGLFALTTVLDLSSAAVLIALYWVPAVVFVFFSLFVASISEIIPGKLYLSNAHAGTSSYWPVKLGISHILDLTGKGEHRYASCRVKRVRVADSLGSQGSLAAVADECMDFVKDAFQGNNGVVLVHCYAGHSRSAAFVMHYLMEEEGMRLAEAYKYVRQRRPVIDVSSDHMGGLRAFDEALREK